MPVCVTRDTEKVGNGKIRRLAILELGGATEQAIAHSTLSRAWSEAGTEGAEVRDMPSGVPPHDPGIRGSKSIYPLRLRPSSVLSWDASGPTHEATSVLSWIDNL